MTTMEGGGGCERDLPVSITTSSSSSYSSSPEFEFWKLRNPSFPQTQLLSADELFVDGVLLPLHLVHSQTQYESRPAKSNDDLLLPQSTPPVAPAEPAVFSAESSKRWKGIFRGSSGEKKAVVVGDEKFRHRKWRNAGGRAAELNINIWPFSRSRSAGEKSIGMGYPLKSAVTGRKVSSAPCSRSNSRGESSKINSVLKNNPGTVSGRIGVPVGRTNPIWKIRRSGNIKTPSSPQTANEEVGRKDFSDVENVDDGGGKNVKRNIGVQIDILNLNVKTRLSKIRQRSSSRCSGEDEALLTDSGEHIKVVGNHFNLKSFFSKKVY